MPACQNSNVQHVPIRDSENAKRPEVSSSTLTWVNQAGVTLVVLIPAARDSITHDFLLPGADAFNLIIFTALPTHDIPLSSRAGFIDDRVLWNRNEHIRTKVLAGRGKTHKNSAAEKHPCSTEVLPFLNDGEDRANPSRPVLPRWVACLEGCPSHPPWHRWNLLELLFIIIF